jgi:F-type H+-transporting ATPase subunit delta
MSDLSHIARPYAKAVFDLARDAEDYATWTDQLELLAAIGANAELSDALQNPAISKQQQIELFVAVGGGKLNAEGENLVKLLAQNDRLNVLAEINEQFVELRDEAEQVIEAQLVTAIKINAKQKSSFEAALSKRLGKKN